MIKQKVLIVDDEALIVSLLKKYLEKDETQYEIDTKEDGSFILDESIENYDLIIFDILMPKINGLELLQNLKDKHPNIKTIAITGMANDEMLRQINSLGCTTILKKPINKNDFLNAVKKQLE